MVWLSACIQWWLDTILISQYSEPPCSEGQFGAAILFVPFREIVLFSEAKDVGTPYRRMHFRV